MTEKLRECPACEGPAVTAFSQANETACRNLDCPMASAWFTREAWNAMPRQSDIDTAVKKERKRNLLLAVQCNDAMDDGGCVDIDDLIRKIERGDEP